MRHMRYVFVQVYTWHRHLSEKLLELCHNTLLALRNRTELNAMFPITVNIQQIELH